LPPVADFSGPAKFSKLHEFYWERKLPYKLAEKGSTVLPNAIPQPEEVSTPQKTNRVAAGFFGGVAKVPVSAIIMACELCGSYTLLVPLMLVAALAYILLGSHSIYEKQLVDRLASPAHLREFARGVLENMPVHEAMVVRPVTLIPENMPFEMLIKLVTGSQDSSFPVVDAPGPTHRHFVRQRPQGHPVRAKPRQGGSGPGCGHPQRGDRLLG
jgi:Voltage gated chloride channel